MTHHTRTLALALLLLGTRTALASAPPILSVAIRLHLKYATVGSTRGMKVVDATTRSAIDARFGGQGVTVTAGLGGGGVRYASGTMHRQLYVVPTPGSLVMVNGKAYRGSLQLMADGAGALNVVNLVDLESYLLGVVKAEMSGTAPLEALKAQAITARTFAFRNRNTFKNRGYGLKSNEQSQVYNGVSGEDPRTNRAVRETRGVIITYDGQPIEGLYHAACGGQTENNEDVWEFHPEPYERSVPCPGCRARPPSPWTADFSYDTIRQRLMEYNWPVGEISDIEFTYTRTNRIKDVILHSASGTVVVPGNNFRIIVDRHTIKSLRFARRGAGAQVADASLDASHPESVSDDDAIRSIIGGYIATSSSRKLSLVGIGSGHGVGLCQWGAEVMAGQGYGYAQIIRTYYTGIALRRLY